MAKITQQINISSTSDVYAGMQDQKDKRNLEVIYVNQIDEKLKATELNMLKEFIRVCQANELQYYLIGGTALGAVRHHGFIPWDDDIDVGMPRKDYNRFLSLAQQSLPDYYFLQTFETDPEYLANFAKIRDNRTTFIESSMKNRRINHGVYIDVFPLDYYPEKNEKWFKLVDVLQVARISKEFASCASTKMRMIQFVAGIIFPSVKATLRKRDEHLQSIHKSSMIANFCGAWGDKETVPSDYFGEGCLMEFEDIKAIVPRKYDSYLTHVYGDYMTPPPVEKQVGHHYTEIIDLDKSFNEYL